jgi:hypothetical protein
LYVLSPETPTAADVYARLPHPELLGPYNLKVMFPPAGAPPVPVVLITGLAGWVAVPLSVAESVTACPRFTSAPAEVDNVGVTGLTVKHSFALESLELGMPLALSPLNAARQQ